MRSSWRQRGLAVGILSATVATASCSLIFGVQGFDSNYGEADAQDARDDRARDGSMEAASPTMPLFHYRRLTTGRGDAAVSALHPGVAFLLDSGTAHPIGCPDRGSIQYFEPSTTLGLEALHNGPYRYGQLAMSAFHAPTAGLESPPGKSRFAFAEVIPGAGDSGSDYPLLIADELTDCDASHPAVRVDPITDPDNAGKAHVLPRFSLDGSRVAYLDLVSDPSGGAKPSLARVVTTGVDGKSPRALRTASHYNPETNVILWGLPPTWIADEQVVWLEGPDPSCSLSHSGCAWPPFQFNYAVDAPLPTYGTLFTCPYLGGYSQIAELAIFADVATSYVAMVASHATLSTSPAEGVMDIYIAEYSALRYDGCSAFADATHLGRKGAVARDMAVSPDGSTIAYTANAGPPSGGSGGDGGGSDGAPPDAGSQEAGAPLDITSPTHVWLLSPAGTKAPTPCSDPAATPTFDDFGPQWFDDGKILVWTRAAHPASAAPEAVGGLWQADVIDGACKNVRPVVSNGPTDAGALTVIAPANATIACDVGLGRPRSDAATTAWGVAFVVAGGARRWRRRRERAGSGRSRPGSMGSNPGVPSRGGEPFREVE
jgi:hypothetical protein